MGPGSRNDVRNSTEQTTREVVLRALAKESRLHRFSTDFLDDSENISRILLTLDISASHPISGNGAADTVRSDRFSARF